MKKTLIKLLVIGTLGLVSSSELAGQTSPYTFGSLGLMKSKGFVQHDLMGGISSNMISANDYSMVNPASLSHIEHTNLQTGSFLSFIDQQSATKRNNNRDGDFGYFSLGLPLSVKKKVGFGASLNRFTALDYSIPGSGIENGESVTNLFAGKGGLSQFTTSFGGQLVDGLSFGVGASFIFGSIEEIVEKQFPESQDVFSVRNTSATFYSGVKYNFGVQYSRQFKKGRQVVVGGHFSPSVSLETSQTQLVQTYNYQGEFFVDTLVERADVSAAQEIPTQFGGSLSYGKKEVWSLGLEYNVAQWSSIIPRGNDNMYFDQTSIAVGGFWQVKEEMNSQHSSKAEKFADYLKVSRIYYGFRTESLYTGVVNKKVDQMVFTLGVGLPLTRTYSIEGEKSRLTSRINIGLEYTVRGNTDPGMIQENILGIKFGLTLTDKWFIKRKYQ